MQSAVSWRWMESRSLLLWTFVLLRARKRLVTDKSWMDERSGWQRHSSTRSLNWPRRSEMDDEIRGWETVFRWTGTGRSPRHQLTSYDDQMLWPGFYVQEIESQLCRSLECSIDQKPHASKIFTRMSVWFKNWCKSVKYTPDFNKIHIPRRCGCEEERDKVKGAHARMLSC